MYNICLIVVSAVPAVWARTKASLMFISPYNMQKKKRPADDLEIEKNGTYFICIRSEKVLNSCCDCMNAASSTEMSLGREISWSCGSSVQDCWRLLAIVTIKYPNLPHFTCTAVDDLNSFQLPVAINILFMLLKIRDRGPTITLQNAEWRLNGNYCFLLATCKRQLWNVFVDGCKVMSLFFSLQVNAFNSMHRLIFWSAMQ